MRDMHERNAERETRRGALRSVADPELVSDLKAICGASAEPELTLKVLSFWESIAIAENNAPMSPTS